MPKGKGPTLLAQVKDDPPYTPEELSKLYKTIDKQIVARKVLIYPPKEARKLPEEIPKQKEINAIRHMLESTQSSALDRAKKVYPTTRPSNLIKLNNKAIKFLKLDGDDGKDFQGYYYMPLLIRAINIHIAANNLRSSKQIVIDKRLAALYDLKEGNKLQNNEILGLTHKLRDTSIQDPFVEDVDVDEDVDDEDSSKKKKKKDKNKKKDKEEEGDEDKEEEDKKKKPTKPKKKIPASITRALEKEKELLQNIYNEQKALKKEMANLDAFEKAEKKDKGTWTREVNKCKENIDERKKKIKKLQKTTRFL